MLPPPVQVSCCYSNSYDISQLESTLKDQDLYKVVRDGPLFFLTVCKAVSQSQRPHPNLAEKFSVCWPGPSNPSFMTLEGDKRTIQKIQTVVEGIRKFFEGYLTEARPLTIIAVSKISSGL